MCKIKIISSSTRDKGVADSLSDKAKKKKKPMIKEWVLQVKANQKAKFALQRHKRTTINIHLLLVTWVTEGIQCILIGVFQSEGLTMQVKDFFNKLGLKLSDVGAQTKLDGYTCHKIFS